MLTAKTEGSGSIPRTRKSKVRADSLNLSSELCVPVACTLPAPTPTQNKIVFKRAKSQIELLQFYRHYHGQAFIPEPIRSWGLWVHSLGGHSNTEDILYDVGKNEEQNTFYCGDILVLL